MHGKAGKHAGRQTETSIDKQTSKLTYKERDRHTDRWVDT